MFAWLITASELTHVIAGSSEIISLALNGGRGPMPAFPNHIRPMLIGNIVGGTGLFAMLAYVQIRQEMQLTS